MDSCEQALLGGWIGGSLDRLLGGREAPDVSVRIDSVRPGSRPTSATIVKWRVAGTPEPLPRLASAVIRADRRPT